MSLQQLGGGRSRARTTPRVPWKTVSCTNGRAGAIEPYGPETGPQGLRGGPRCGSPVTSGNIEGAEGSLGFSQRGVMNNLRCSGMFKLWGKESEVQGSARTPFRSVAPGQGLIRRLRVCLGFVSGFKTRNAQSSAIPGARKAASAAVKTRASTGLVGLDEDGEHTCQSACEARRPKT